MSAPIGSLPGPVGEALHFQFLAAPRQQPTLSLPTMLLACYAMVSAGSRWNRK